MKIRLFNNTLIIMLVLLCNPAGYLAFAASESESLTDLTGLWVVSNRSLRGNRDEDFNLLEPEDYLNASGLEAISTVRPAYDPSAMCLPSIPRHLGGPYPIEIIQNEDRVVQLFEYDNVFRIIYTDGREHPDPIEDQRFMGHAIASWEGETLVVDTQNFNGKAWLAANGLPVSPKAHLTEWYSLIEDGLTLQLIVKYEDEEYFTRPIWQNYYFNLKNEWGIREYFCAEGNRDNVFNQQGLPGSLQIDDVITE